MVQGNHNDPAEIPVNITLDVTISDPLNSTSASIQWDEPPTCGHCTDCGYFITLDGGATMTRNTGGSGSPTHELNGLKPFTMYSIQARAECADGGRTPFSIPFNFTTERAGEQWQTSTQTCMPTHPAYLLYPTTLSPIVVLSNHVYSLHEHVHYAV